VGHPSTEAPGSVSDAIGCAGILVTTTLTVHAAKAHLSRLIEQALRGEEVSIARGDEPVLRLVPIDAPRPRRQFGSLKGLIEVPDRLFDPLPENELRLWEGG
jgi:antitoxin (DNA-binding transcriptional repressor) of toxin-antitoxin stability system